MAFALDWLNLLFRWAHLVVGIGWIGTSFYFIALDLALKKREVMNPGVYGTSWQVHGGGFYHVEKYMVAPGTLPQDLVWFKWEAYLTWVTGFLLLIAIYYWNARAYLIDPSVLALEPWQAVAISIATLVAGWFAYNALCRSPIGKNVPLLGAAVFVLIIAAAVLYQNVYSGRGAMIHVGAFIGTMMAVNVFGVIVPNQRRITADLVAGRAPDPSLGATGKQRSVHNNYLTLPVLVFMVSNHYPMLTSHPQMWLIVALILIAGAMVRHLINRHDAGEHLVRNIWTLPVAVVALGIAIFMTAPSPPVAAPGGVAVNEAAAMAIVQSHCVSCHSATPTQEGFDVAPKDVKLDTATEVLLHRDAVLAQAVHSEAMPLGNMTGMTPEERAALGAWLEGR